MAPLCTLGTPRFFRSSQSMAYTMMQNGLALFSQRDTPLRAYWKSQYLNELTDEAINVIADLVQNPPTPLTTLNTWHLGGAISDVGPEETAFAERSAPFMVEISGNWLKADDDYRTIKWVKWAWERLKPYGTGRGYLNLTGERAGEPVRAGVDDALSRNLSRLAKIKRTYDPDNFFRYNNNIPPR